MCGVPASPLSVLLLSPWSVGAQGLTVSGKWARATKSANDPNGAAQGVDLIVVTGTAAAPTGE
jgi:hypothetical protein